ncbi:MAG: ABC transporter permease [Clostridiales bacterium]|nr:ABC transporter permease [Clostridiales bacterium]
MKGYYKYFGSKLLWFFVTFLCALVLNFILPRLMPADPVQMIVGQIASGIQSADTIQEIYRQYASRFGLDKPVAQQFFIYIGNLLRGDMGVSFTTERGRAITDLLSSALVWEIALQLPAILVGWILGNVLGALAAYIRKGFDKVLVPVSLFLGGLPAFGMAISLLVLFAINLKIAPISGGYGFDLVPAFTPTFVWSVITHYQLPFWSIVLIAIGGQAIGMRSMSIYELNADYVKYSRFLGIKDSKIVGYVFRNAMLPQITGLALSIGTMIGGALVAETVFNYPGLGTTLYKGLLRSDYPLISGSTLIVTIMVLFASFIIEIIYGLIDPRVKANQMD